VFIGCQFSLYPMTEAYVSVIMEAINSLDRYGLSRRSSDDLSTFMLGPPDALLEALASTWVAAAASGHHVVMSLTLSRGCPGEPDEPCCRTRLTPSTTNSTSTQNLVDPTAHALERIYKAGTMATPITTYGQYSVYPLGDIGYMDRIMAVIQAAKHEGIFDGAKHFMSRLAGTPADIFCHFYRTFAQPADVDAHLVIQATLSANSPSNNASATTHKGVNHV